MNQGNFSSSRQKDSFSLYPSLPPSPPSLLPAPPSFHPAPSSSLRPFLILSLPLRRPRAWLDVSFCFSFSFFSFFLSSPSPSSLPTSFGRWLRGLSLSEGNVSRQDRSLLARRAGCLSEPRSESVGITKEKGLLLGRRRSFTVQRAKEWAGGGGLGVWKHWSRTLVAPRSG